MAATKIEIRRGTYYDSITLMQLQAELMQLPGISNAGVMLATDANKELLKEQGLLSAEAQECSGSDLIISIQGDNKAATETALGKVDTLLSRRRSHDEQDYLPKSLEAAVKMLPEAQWVLVSVPGNYAASVAKEGLRHGKNIFLYSDNVSLEDEVALKKDASKKGLLVMGADCGTAIINEVGLGFANKVRRGPIGLIGASGTGLQQVTARIHQLGSGITHAIGTGGRDLSTSVGGITALQALDLLRRDSETQVMVLISKPADSKVVSRLLQRAREAGKHVVINLLGHRAMQLEKNTNLHFASSLDAAAELAVKLVNTPTTSARETAAREMSPSGQKYLRGLFSGGTLAYETLLILQDYLPNLYSNIPLKKEQALANPLVSHKHTILDLGEDEFTVGRPHPMLDNTLRLQRLAKEASDPEVAIILLDVVLGYGAHPDPASELAPALSNAISSAQKNGRNLEVIVTVVGTDEDPQDLKAQIKKFKTAGARVETSSREAALYVGQRLQSQEKATELTAVDLKVLQQPLQAINVGLASFSESLRQQGATVIHVDWRPPAGGNEKLISILERMKKS